MQLSRREAGASGSLTGLIYYMGEFGFGCSGEEVEPGGNVTGDGGFEEWFINEG